MIKAKYEMGDTLKDIVSGYEGIVMVVALYSTGCLHYGLAPTKLKDNVIGNWEWLDQSRLILVESNTINFKLEHDMYSGALPNPPQS